MNFTRIIVVAFAALLFWGCTSDGGINKAISIEYQLDTKSVTGDHFFVTYTDAHGDSITEHQHPGWRYNFNSTVPFSTYLEVSINPVDSYEFVYRILINGKVVARDSASTASGAAITRHIAYTIN